MDEKVIIHKIRNPEINIQILTGNCIVKPLKVAIAFV